jgi:hypothetical protein
MSDRERTDAGTFAETVPLDAVLGVFDEVRGPVITTSDVAEHLECTTEAARQKLTRLYDQGKVDKRKTGRTTVWWQTAGDEFDAGDLRGDAETTLADPAPEDTVGDSQEARDTPSADGVGSEREASVEETPPTAPAETTHTPTHDDEDSVEDADVYDPTEEF